MGGLYGNAAATALEDCPEEARGLMSGMLQQGVSNNVPLHWRSVSNCCSMLSGTFSVPHLLAVSSIQPPTTGVLSSGSALAPLSSSSSLV